MNDLAGRFDHVHGDEDLIPEQDLREHERRVDDEIAYLIRVPSDYCAKAEEEMVPRLVSIITDREGDKLGRLRDILDADLLRVATEEVEHD